MKAVRVHNPGGSEVLSYEEVDKPTPGDGFLLVKNEYIGVNYIDTYFRTGLYPLPPPFGLGVEGAGVVEAVGPGVQGFASGDIVGYITRPVLGPSYAAYTTVRSDLAVKLPDGINTQTAAAVLLQGLTALSMVKITCEVQKGDWVLVHAAAGGTGQLLVRLCDHIGAHVIGTVSTPQKAEVAKKCGCEEVILYTQEDVLKKVLGLTGGKGVKFVYDGVGKSTFDTSLKCLDALGWLISFGNASGKPEPFDVLRLGDKSLRLMRPSLFSTLAARPGLTAELSAELLSLIRQGVVVPEIHKVYTLSEAKAAHDDLEGRKTTGKLLLKP